MIHTQKKTAVGLLPLRVPFTRWKVDELQVVAVRILEVESLDAGRRLIPVGNPLRPGGSVRYFMHAQLLVGLVHVADDNGDVLEPLIVAARVRGDWSASGHKISGEFDELIAQTHAHDSHPLPEDALKPFVFVAYHLDV